MSFNILALTSITLLVAGSESTTWSGPGPSGTCGREDCGSGCPFPPFPAIAELPIIAPLPDPFTFSNGSAVTTLAQWPCRRAEASDLLQHYELGVKTPAAVKTTGTVSSSSIDVTVALADGSGAPVSFSASVQLPTTGTKPFPFLVGVCGVFLNSQAILSLGVAIVNFDCNSMAQQNDASSRGIGLFYDLFGKDNNGNATAGALAAWAWGVSRLLDVVETDSAGILDASHAGVTGCSRNGKGALTVGALDERIALTIPQESGSGGSASWRISDWQGTTVQTLGEIVDENVWFATELAQFGPSPPGSHATLLPTDHHELLGMVAPRGLLVIENTGMVWLGNQSTWGASVAGRKVFEALGVPDHMGASQVGGHSHCQFPDSQQPAVDAFVRKFLLSDASQNTTIMYTDGGYQFDEQKWAPWKVPSLT
jgi:hypothetical protein